METKVIETEADYEQALLVLEDVFDVVSRSREGKQLERLSKLIEQYQKNTFQ